MNIEDEYDRLTEREKNTLLMLVEWGGVDGGHHKAWVIDQAIRVLTDCPVEARTAKDYRGEEYTFTALGKSEFYRELVRLAKDGEDGPETYDWDEGIAP